MKRVRCAGVASNLAFHASKALLPGSKLSGASASVRVAQQLAVELRCEDFAAGSVVAKPFRELMASYAQHVGRNLS